MKKILFILMFLSTTCFSEVCKVEIQTEFEGFKKIYIAVCPICCEVNKVDFNNRFVGHKCKHFINTRKFMVFEKTESEKLKDEIERLKARIKELENNNIFFSPKPGIFELKSNPCDVQKIKGNSKGRY